MMKKSQSGMIIIRAREKRRIRGFIEISGTTERESGFKPRGPDHTEADGTRPARKRSCPPCRRAEFTPSSRDPSLRRYMPKHVPTFKHLLNTSATNAQAADPPERGVNELLASSRRHKPVQREIPPHIARGERIWAPSADAGSSGLVEFEDGGVHP